MSKPRWIGFDLDGTLHDMVRVQRTADLVVFSEMSQCCELTAEELRQTYRTVNAQHLSPDFFANGLSANEHRLLRYETLLNHLAIRDDYLAQQCIETFYNSFGENAQLYPGVETVLQDLKDSDFLIAIITERPHDSAEHALDCLGLTSMVDLLVTTGGERLSKPDGLFSRALERMDTTETDIALIGDNLERDIRPAITAGMNAIWYVHPDNLPQTVPQDIRHATTLISDHRDILSLI